MADDLELTKDERAEVSFLHPSLWSDSVKEKIGGFLEKSAQPTQSSQQHETQGESIASDKATYQNTPMVQTLRGTMREAQQGRPQVNTSSPVNVNLNTNLSPEDLNRMYIEKQQQNEGARARAMNERAIDYTTPEPMANPEPTQMSPYGFQNAPQVQSRQLPSPISSLNYQFGNPPPNPQYGDPTLDRFHISNLIWDPRQSLAQNDRRDINDMLGQTPETGFLQPKQTPTPSPTPPPVKKENTYYG